jgi:hypothetical protein
VNVSVNVFIVIVRDDVSPIRVVVEWVVGSTSAGIDGDRLLFVIVERSRTVDSSAAFADTTCRCPVLRSPSVNPDGLSDMGPTPAHGEPPSGRHSRRLR